MSYDCCSHLAKKQNPIIENILNLEKEINNERNKQKKEQKETEVENLRKKLLSQNPHLFYHVLAVKNNSSEDALRSTWQKENLQQELDNSLCDSLINDPSIDISLLPNLSFIIQFRFTLEKPYISRDEQDLYIIDNPIRKDKVFGLPYVAPTSWKGSLRAAMWQNGYKGDNAQIDRIFGNERGVEEQAKLKAGRLRLFPTFFNRIGLEIINPHDRKKRVGRNPILMECVPIGTSGLFTALYVPFDNVGKDSELNKKQVSEDIKLLTKSLKEMFRDYGFGAKTSSGYGQAKNELDTGSIILRAKGIEVKSKNQPLIQPPEEPFLKYLNDEGNVKDEFRGGGEADLLSTKEYKRKGQASGGGSLSEFKKFRRWYGNYGEKWQNELRLKITSDDWPTWKFESFDRFLKAGEEIEKTLSSREDSQ